MRIDESNGEPLAIKQANLTRVAVHADAVQQQCLQSVGLGVRRFREGDIVRFQGRYGFVLSCREEQDGRCICNLKQEWKSGATVEADQEDVTW